MYIKRMPFTEEEFKGRLKKVQEEIKARGLDMMLIHTPENIFYLTGHHSAGYYMYTCLVVHPTKEPVLVVRYGEVGNALIYSFLNEDNLCIYDDTDDPLEKTVEAIKRLEAAPKKIGTEETSFFFSIKNYKALAGKLPAAELVSATGLVEQFRIVKSPAELDYIRQACRAVNAGMRAGMDKIKKGENENNVAAAIWQAIVSNGCQHVGMEPFVAKGWKSGLMHNVWSGDTIEDGDCILLEIPAAINRYHGALMRSAYVGNPPAIIKEWSAVCIESLNAALKAIKPGVTSGDVDEACRGVIERAGLYDHFRKRTGYSIGCAFAPDWGEGHICSLQKGDKRVLVPGMVYHMPPAIRMLGEFGVGFSETVIVTESGCEICTDYPRELIIK